MVPLQLAGTAIELAPGARPGVETRRPLFRRRQACTEQTAGPLVISLCFNVCG
jgi:hypothetical protein